MKIFEITFFGITIAPSYYGLFYAISFLMGYHILKKRKFLDEKNLDDLIIYIFLGVIIGGRIGYILFYDLGFYLNNPSEIYKFWHGGMSFHGGVIGVIIAMIFFNYKYSNYQSHSFSCHSRAPGKKYSWGESGNPYKNRHSELQGEKDTEINSVGRIKFFYKLSDQITSILPIGLGLGRIGNYLNKELLGKTYSGFLAVEKNGQTYFPSPLLEAFLEGLVLYFILQFILKKSKYHGNTAGGFLFFYGIFRFLVEFVRLPDSQLGYIFSYFTMGQILSFPMILVGTYFLFFFKKYTKVN